MRNTSHTTRQLNRSTGLLLALLMVVFTATPVLAEGTTTTTTAADTSTTTILPGSDTLPATPGNGGVQVGDLGAHYQSLAAALLANRPEISAEFGSFGAGFGLPNRESLLGNGYAFAIDTKGFTNLWEYTSSFNAKAGLDGKISQAAAVWATQLGSIKVPELKIEDLSVPELEVPEEALLFGLVYDQSLAHLVGDSKVLSDVKSLGFDSAAFKSAWAQSMGQATDVVSRNLGEGLISPCHGAFLAAMGGGVPAVGSYGLSDCSACVAGGLYMRQEMTRLIEPTADAVWEDETDDIVTHTDYMAEIPGVIQVLQSDSWWVRQTKTIARAPSLIDGQAGKCVASLSAGKQGVSQVLEGVASKLKGPNTPD